MNLVFNKIFFFQGCQRWQGQLRGCQAQGSGQENPGSHARCTEEDQRGRRSRQTRGRGTDKARRGGGDTETGTDSSGAGAEREEEAKREGTEGEVESWR